MKQSFTLKAVALGLAAAATLGASAARPQVSFNAAAPLNVQAELSSVKQAKIQTKTTNAGAQPYSTLASRKLTMPNENQTQVQQPVSRAINPYGPWEDAGTLTYTFNNLFDGNGPTKTYNYQKRVNSQNPNNFQIKVANWGAFTAAEAGEEIPGCELVLTVTPAIDSSTGKTEYVVTTTNPETNVNEGLPLGWQAGGPNNTTFDLYYYDHYTYAQTVSKYNSNWTAEAVASWYASSVFDPQSGQFELMPIYGGAGTNSIYSLAYGELNAAGTQYTKYWYDYIQLSGEYYNYDFDIDTYAGYFYRNAGEAAGHYKAPFVLNDNAVGVVKILSGELTTQEQLQAEFNKMVDEMSSPSADMAVFDAAEGWFDIEVSPYADGYYTLLYGIGKAPEADGSMDINGGYYTIILDGAEFVLDGFAKYNDVVVPAFLSLFSVDHDGNPNTPAVSVTPEMMGLPATYTTTCQVEKSENTAGLYRLRAPYAEYPGDELFDYNQTLDYLYYDISNPAEAYVDFSFTGQSLTIGSGTRYVGCASTHIALDDAKQTIFGSFADNKFTFPATTYTQEFEFSTASGSTQMVSKPLSGLLVMALVPTTTGIGISDFTSPENPQDFLIETGAVDAIENVEASTDTNAPVEYYNLQGQKVINPAAGQLVIKKQGGKVTKMIAQ